MTSTTLSNADTIRHWLDSTELAIELPPLHITPARLLFRVFPEYNTMQPYTDHNQASANDTQQNPNTHPNSPVAPVFNTQNHGLPQTPATTSRGPSSKHARGRSMPSMQAPSFQNSARIEKRLPPKKDAVSPGKMHALYDPFGDDLNTPPSQTTALPSIQTLFHGLSEQQAYEQMGGAMQVQMDLQPRPLWQKSGSSINVPALEHSSGHTPGVFAQYPVMPPREYSNPTNEFSAMSPVKKSQGYPVGPPRTPPSTRTNLMSATASLSIQQDNQTNGSTAPASPGKRDFKRLENLVKPVCYRVRTHDFKLPHTIRDLWDRLDAIADGKEVLPSRLRNEINTYEDGRIFGYESVQNFHCYDDRDIPDHIVKEDLLHVWDIVIQDEENQDLPEECHYGLHEQVFFFAFKRHCTRLKCCAANPAHISPNFLPKFPDGTRAPQRRVDLFVTLKPSEVTSEEIENFLNGQAEKSRTLNFSRNAGYEKKILRLFGEVKIKETKASWEEAQTQTGTVVAATYERIKQFPNPPRYTPPIPVVYILGRRWYIWFAWEEESSICILKSEKPIGDTRTRIGVFKLFAALRAIGKHLELESEDWFADSVRACSDQMQ